MKNLKKGLRILSIKISLLSLALSFVGAPLGFSSAPLTQPSSSKGEMNKTAPALKKFPVSIQILGIPDTMKASILNTIPLKVGTSLPYQKASLLYQQSFSEMHEAFKPIGYYDVEVSGELSEQNQAVFKINLGSPILVAQVDIQIIGEGKDDKALQSVVAKSGLTSGIVFVHAQYETLKETLLNLANQRGYFDAKFTQSEIQVQALKNEASLILYLDTGARYHFGGVSFKQTNYEFNNAFLQAYVPFSRREYYSTHQFNQFQSLLSDSGYFKNVYLQTQQDSTTHLINIEANTETLPAYEYVIGPGYGTDTGPRILLGFKARHINPEGQKFALESQISSIYKNISADYTIPSFSNPSMNHFDFEIGQNYTHISAYSSRDTSFGVEWSSTHGHTSRIVGLKQHIIFFTPQNQAADHGSYLVPSLNYSYLNQSRSGYFQKGILLSATIQGASDYFFSDASFIQTLINSRISLPFAQDARVMLAGQVGATKAANFGKLPTPYRFYAGGLDSVLGYSYYSLSPSNASGLTGGRDLLTAAIAIEKRVYQQLSAQIFFNAGNAFNQFNHLKLQEALGVGLSYRSRVGPISLYLSKPVRSSIQQALSFNFSIGAFL